MNTTDRWRVPRFTLCAVLTFGCLVVAGGPPSTDAVAVSLAFAPEQDRPGAFSTDLTESVPGPPSSYVLTLADVGSGFRKAERGEDRDGRAHQIVLRRMAGVSGSDAEVQQVDSRVEIEAPGANAEAAARYEQLLVGLRGQPEMTVQPDRDPNSEQVHTYRGRRDGKDICGATLKHLNVVATVKTYGSSQVGACDAASRYMRIVEDKIHKAVQRPTAAGSWPVSMLAL